MAYYHPDTAKMTRQAEGQNVSQAASRENLVAWLALCLSVGVVVILYLGVSLSISHDPLLMPLDDTYIHFQYARQWAAGHPMTYFPGDPPTSGGTSLLYPLLLGVGYGIGFVNWSLAYWALGLGVLGHLGASWLVYQLGRSPFGQGQPSAEPFWHALVMAVAFAVSGPFVWAALSGMETALFVFVCLLTLYAVAEERGWLLVLGATLAALTRPEGAIPATLAVFWSVMRGRSTESVRQRLKWAIPIMAIAVQPVLNWAVTGSMSSSGMQAKSILLNTSIPLESRLGDVLEFFVKMWRELLTGNNPDFGLFTSPVLAIVALAGMILGAAWEVKNRQAGVGLLSLAWVVLFTVAVATLDTAFWQFKRYQLPVMAMFFPVAAWVSAKVHHMLIRLGWGRVGVVLLPLAVGVPSLVTTITFARNYAENVTVVRDQQVPMATWVRENLDQVLDVSIDGDQSRFRVGVHDVGLMGYFSGLPLYDVVGLTLPGPAPSWRQGPGTIYEHMAHSRYRPVAFAIYPQVQGLEYLRNAGVFGEVLAEFPVELPAHNVAAATGYQAVYRANWATTVAEERVAQFNVVDIVENMTLVDSVDVANLDSEHAHDYTWWQKEQPAGFVSEVYTHPYHACGRTGEGACWATDGGRVLTGGEEFVLSTRPGEDLMLVTRVHSRQSVPLDIFIDGERVAQRVQPELPGRWVEIVTWIPGDRIGHPETRVRIEVAATGDANQAYLPCYHWAFQGSFEPETVAETTPLATFGETHSIRLVSAQVDYKVESSDRNRVIRVRVTWQGPAPDSGDGVVFVHLYNSGQIDTEPIAQVVSRPGRGVLPPANWLPGTIEDVVELPLPDALPPGTYVVALGLFDAQTGMRYPVDASGIMTDDGRLFLDEIIVEENPE